MRFGLGGSVGASMLDHFAQFDQQAHEFGRGVADTLCDRTRVREPLSVAI
jgi:hypothetical protein